MASSRNSTSSKRSHNGQHVRAGIYPNRRMQSSIHSNSSTVLTQITPSETYTSLLEQVRSAEGQNGSNTQLHRLMIDTYGNRSPIKKTISSLLRSGKSRSSIIFHSILFILLWKWLIGLGAYSGYRAPPLFGDLEAQRHWMALTVHIKLEEWYYFHLEYWGLDYPPLTAYHSLFIGQIAKLINPKFVLLRPPSPDLNGWGDELHSQLKIFLRSSVLASEMLIWIPIVLTYHFNTYRFNSLSSNHRPKDNHQRLKNLSSGSIHHPILSDRLWLGAMYSISVVLLNPNIILIDNGHFQFNSIMLGLTLASVTCFYAGRDLLGAIMFVCSLAFKQMALYYSPAIFAYLFGKCLYLGHPNGTKLFIQLALVSTGMVGILFGPFIFNQDFPQLIIQVLQRIFPIGRGLFEDKVGNFWCTLNMIVKIRTLATVKSLANIALLFTMGAVLPGMLIVILSSWKSNPNRSSTSKPSPSIADLPSSTKLIPKTIDILPLTLFNSSIGFYLFSFQVHEKSILLPILPLLLIFSRHHKNRKRDSPIVLQMDWHIICLISNVSIFSMWPLLKRDQLGIQYLVSILSYNHMIGYNPVSLITKSSRNLVSWTIWAIYMGMIGIHISEQIIKPPIHLPDLFVVLNLALSFTVFFASYVWSLIRIYQDAWSLNGFKMSENHKLGISRKVGDHDPDTKSVINHERAECSLLCEEVDAEEGEFQVKLPTKRSTSLQQHGTRKIKAINQSESETETELQELKSRSVGASSGLGLAIVKKRMLKDSSLGSRSSSKAIISSPSGEKLMNRIKNRIHLDASRSKSRSRSRSSQRSATQEPKRINTEAEEQQQQQQQERDQQRQEGEEEEPDDAVASPRESEAKEDLSRLPTGLKESHKISPSSPNDFDRLQRIESAWEIALRQSRDEAIRRRREELLVTRNLKR